MHRVLTRQLRRLGLTPDESPRDPASWRRLLDRVDSSYRHADVSRYQLERSVTVATEELSEMNRLLAEHAEARVAESEQRFMTLFELNPVPTWEENFGLVEKELHRLRGEDVSDLRAHLEGDLAGLREILSLAEVNRVNPAAARLVRAESTGSMLGPVSSVMVDDQNASAWISQLETIWNGLGYLKLDPLVGHRQDGEMFHGILEWHATEVGDGFDYSRVVVTIVDITRRVEAENRLHDVLKSKDEFLASISHELRTPLTSVLGFAEVLRAMDAGTSETERDSLLEIIASQAADLSNIVEDLLVAARAELGVLSVVAVPVDIQAQIRQVMEARREADKDIDVRIAPDGMPKALGDPQRVRQILRNLVTNADRYGGEQVFVESAYTDAQVSVRVCDNGSGVDPEIREQIFDRYYRSHQDGGQPGSVGIGLTISRELARIMGGDLWLEERQGMTVFTLVLPR